MFSLFQVFSRLPQNAHLLRCGAAFVTAAYKKVRLSQIPLLRGFFMIPHALHLHFFEQPV